MSYIADKRYYANGPLNDPESVIVDEGSEDARFLLIGEGQEMQEAEAKRWGLMAEDAVEQSSEEAKK